MKSFTAMPVVVMLLLVACGRGPAPETAVTDDVPPAAVPTTSATIDPVTGFRMSEDWDLVRAHCTGCHSAKLITQQRGTAQQWLAMIRWMQEKQNLWQFDADTEERIIAYLATNYPPDAARRRAAIPPDLMPPNPYSQPTAAVN